jgi:hypothetical protein
MAPSMSRLFDEVPAERWVCWDRLPVMYVCYNADGCSYYPMDTGLEARGPFPCFSWEYAMAPDGRGGFYVTGGHDEVEQVRVRDPYSVGHKEPFPDSFFGPMVSELWRYDVRRNGWQEVRQAAWGPRQCVAARHMTYDALHDCLVRTAACREGHSPKPPVPLRGWGIFGVWVYDIQRRAWTWMQPSVSLGPLTYDTKRHVVLGAKEGRVGVYDVHSNTVILRPETTPAPKGEGAFAYDAAHDLALFVGESGETWTYDIDTNAWTERRPEPHPAPRKGFGFALDPATGFGLLFGGRGDPRHFADTWTYDVGANAWRPHDLPMRPEGRFWWGQGILFDEVTRAFVLYGGLAQYERVEARYATGDVWVWKRAAETRPAGPALAAPKGIIQTEARAVTLTWTAVRGAAKYRLERGTGQPGAVRFELLAERPGRERTYTDTTVEPGTRYEYRVCGVKSTGAAGAWSAPLRTDPPAPRGLVVSALGRRGVEIIWQPSEDAALYRLRRVRIVGDDQFADETMLDAGPKARYVDQPDRAPEEHYQYQVQVVNTLGVPSGWSAPAGTIPSAPAHLVIRPNAARRSITLTWPANPEKNIVGYNLYRWVEPPFRFAFQTEPELITPAWWTFDERKNPSERMLWVKVNDTPIKGTRFVDSGLKLVTAWYYIRAVNSLGVEGHFRTSYAMPVWRWYGTARRYF